MSAKQKVMIAVDGSDQAKYAFNWYLENCHREGNEVDIVHCFENTLSVGFPGGNPDVAKINEYVEKLKILNAEREDVTNHFMDVLRSKNIVAKAHHVDGKPGETITDLSKKEGIDHIVVGTRGLGTIRRTMLGSVSEYLIHHCDCPVTVVRKK